MTRNTDHVIRLSRRLGLSENQDPVKLEFDLTDMVSRRYWTHFNHLMMSHGRTLCKARNTLCHECPISILCSAVKYPSLL